MDSNKRRERVVVEFLGGVRGGGVRRRGAGIVGGVAVADEVALADAAAAAVVAVASQDVAGLERLHNDGNVLNDDLVAPERGQGVLGAGIVAEPHLRKLARNKQGAC